VEDCGKERASILDAEAESALRIFEIWCAVFSFGVCGIGRRIGFEGAEVAEAAMTRWRNW
jgi:hypothetical protein